MKTLHYKHSRFVTQMPMDYRYSPSHYWAWERTPGVWRIGLTKFATRMLGDIVDHGIETAPGARLELGQTLGWIEGFKAISDLYAMGEGEFGEPNPILKERAATVSKRPYDEGWLYEMRGSLDPRCMDVHGYKELLDATIQRMLEKEQAEETP